jgi:hypothetical protein
MASDYMEQLKTLNTFFPPVYDEGALPCLNHPIGRTTINMNLDIEKEENSSVLPLS